MKKVNFIVSENSFEKFMMHVILGTTGAAMDVEMNFFFTFWGLYLLKKDFKPKVSGAPMASIMGGMAAGMFKKKLKAFGYEDIWGMVKEQIEDGKIHLYPCTMTMDLLGIKQEDLFDFVEPGVGAAAFLGMCGDADFMISL